MILTLAGCFFANAGFASENRSASTDSSPTPPAETAAPSPSARDQLKSEVETTVEPDLPQSAGLEQIAAEQPATPRRIHYRVGLSVREAYDDNINLTNTNREDDFYTTVEPTVTLGFGNSDENFLELSYSPSAYFFVKHTENNALQHLIALTGQYRFPILTLNLTQNIQILDGAPLSNPTGVGSGFSRNSLDFSGRTAENIYTTTLNANYSLTGKTFLTGGLNYSVTAYETLLSSSIVTANLYFNYTYSPKLAIGVGLAGGYDQVDSPSQDQTFEQLNVRASYELTGKVSATVSAGIEFRQATDSSAGNNVSPVFSGDLFYQPFDGTSLSLSLSGSNQNSAILAGQDYYLASITLSARQRFFQRVFLGLSVGLDYSSYYSTLSGVSSTRIDDYYFIQVSLDLDITRYWSAGVYYFYREDDSTLAFSNFYDNQLGLRTSLAF